ncbi:hypothetical protein FH972_015935 [Carpinus fangiana]|uniref:Uncharacterized protein n=1 Tax=Carpinus fangiana TaxID=176857 RepID=A0A5N6RFH6_9ROSI|nr:hypothetical protein FH972_015935 [Carpinus fangiana]
MAAGYGLAEIYVLRKLHKEKMKTMEMEEEERAGGEYNLKEKKSSTGCFFWGFKKIHPNTTTSRTMDCAAKDMETWDISKT